MTVDANNIKNAASFFFKKREMIGKLLKETFSNKTISGLLEGTIMIPETKILQELKKQKDFGQWIRSFRCNNEGLFIELEGRKFAGTLLAKTHLYVQTLRLSDREQIIEMKIIDESLKGKDILGKIACSTAKILLESFTRYGIEQSELSKHVIFHDASKTFSIEIGHLEIVKKLLSPKLFNFKGSAPLRLVEIESASHVDGGITLNLRRSALVESYLNKTRNAIKSVKNGIRGNVDQP